MVIQLLVYGGLYPLLGGSPLYPSFDFDALNGVFGWLTPRNFVYSFLVYGFVTRYAVSVTYVFAFYYFSAIIVSNIFMLEPILGQLIGICLGQDHLPGVTTMCGIVTVIYGVLTQTQDLSDQYEE